VSLNESVFRNILWIWRQQALITCWYPYTIIHNVITKKMKAFIRTAVRVSDVRLAEAEAMHPLTAWVPGLHIIPWVEILSFYSYMQQATATDRYVRQMSEYRNDSCCEAVDNSVCFVDIVTPTLANSDHMVVASLMLTGCLSINFLVHSENMRSHNTSSRL
jgi:hypothetical protein